MRATLRDEYDHALRVYRGAVAVQCGEEQLTFGGLDLWSTAVAHQLAGFGIGPGDVVAIYAHNAAEFAVADVAIARLGAVKLPVNYMLPAATVGHIFAVSQVAAVLFDPRLSGPLTEAMSVAGRGDVPLVQLRPAADGATADLPDRAVAMVRMPVEPPPALDYTAFPLSSQSPAALYFTGGTTGLPKGVLHTQASTVALHHAQLLEAEIHQDERLLLMTPLAHAAGLFMQSALLRGATSVMTDGFDARTAVKLIEDERITWTFLVPTMIYRVLDVLAEQPGQRSGLRTIVYGAAPISATRLHQALDLLGSIFIQLYGQTECPNWGTRLAKSDHDLDRPEILSSCGRASFMADVKVVDDDGVDLPPNVTGEICLRSPYLLTEYLGDEAATVKKFLDGWILTGDIGELDEDGYLYLKDRKNDMVISGGMNVYCREVEDVLSAHPSVAAVAVIGIPDDDWGEAVHAVVVPRDDSFSASELLAWARGSLAAYAKPKSVEVVASLPETPFGKIDKKALRASHWADRSRSIG